jgi:uncharacterized protein YkwD
MNKLILWIVSLFKRTSNKPLRYNLDAQYEVLSEMEFREDMFSEINQFRKENNLKEYVHHGNLSKVAVQHSKDMVYRNKASHEYFTERQRMFPDLIISEVVGYNYRSPMGFLNGFLNSENHKRIFFNRDYCYIGIGSETNKEGKRFVTIIFAKNK